MRARAANCSHFVAAAVFVFSMRRDVPVLAPVPHRCLRLPCMPACIHTPLLRRRNPARTTLQNTCFTKCYTCYVRSRQNKRVGAMLPRSAAGAPADAAGYIAALEDEVRHAKFLCMHAAKSMHN
jgi:hypothetical protein